MSQVLTVDDVQAIYPQAPESARIYTYPLAGVTPWGVAEWDTRRVHLHSVAAHWVAGRPARKPDRGWPLFAADAWEPLGAIYLVATEREASALMRFGLNATTWDGDAGQMKFSDWSALDGRPVHVWMDDNTSRLASAHLWRHSYVLIDAPPLEWLKAAWERLGGDMDAIRQDIEWTRRGDVAGAKVA